MKILFLNPSRTGQGSIPINVPLLIGALKQKHHKVKLFDMSDYDVFDDKSYDDMFFKEASFDERKVVLERKAFYKEDYGVVVDGCGLKKTAYVVDFENILRAFNPDIIAVTSMSVDFDFACDFLKPLKQKYNIPIIFGGIHAILLPEETLMSSVCDYVCTGEGEKCLVELVEAMETGKPLENVRGIWFKREEKICKNEPELLTDLEDIPIVDFDCYDPIHFYRPFDGRKYKMLNYEVSRGCPFSCTYCVNGVLKEKYKDLGSYNRKKNVKQSIHELEYLIKKYNFDFIRFWDEDFTSLPLEYLQEYSRMYIEKIKLPFLIYARVNTVTEEKVKILKEMGCRTFAMGIESGNEFIRKKVMNRIMSNDLIAEKFGLVKQYGIRVSAYNIMGLPLETRERIFDTIALNKKIMPDSFSVTLLEPYRGTPIRKMCEDEGLPETHKTSFGEAQFVPKGMTYEELKGLFRTFAFYVHFPEEEYNKIKKAETDDGVYEDLVKEYKELIKK